MSNRFIYDFDKCVACSACSVACVLTNSFAVSVRNVYSNFDSTVNQPVINLSMACNHCEKPVCMDGCPAASYSRDKLTGAVVPDEKKCIGCRYCLWNCPYDAPKYIERNGTVIKCNFCVSLLKESVTPACVSACPTGALGFSGNDGETMIYPEWLPDKGLHPSLRINEGLSSLPLKIIPEAIFGNQPVNENYREKLPAFDISLLVFSLLATISVSFIASSFINGSFPSPVFFIPLIVGTGIVSLFHLGKPWRAWRALLNIRSSPLSREIAFYIIFSVLSTVSVFFNFTSLLVISSLSGFLFLLSIDRVYIYSDKRNSVVFHSGQTFLNSMLLISYFTGNMVPFTFIFLLNIFLSFKNRNINDVSFSNMRFFRLALLIIVWIKLMLENNKPEIFITVLFIISILIDRAVFYIDFDPQSIKDQKYNFIKIVSNEKERS